MNSDATQPHDQETRTYRKLRFLIRSGNESELWGALQESGYLTNHPLVAGLEYIVGQQKTKRSISASSDSSTEVRLKITCIEY